MPAAARIAGTESRSVTINGIGERCGNAPLEECVVALKILYGIDLAPLTAIVRSVAALLEKNTSARLRVRRPLKGECVSVG